jgi:uncharacterized protein YggE
MTESVASPPVPPLHYAVLVPQELPAVAGTGVRQGWHVIYANGDMAAARAKAEEWAHANAGQQAVVVQYLDHVQIVPVPKWAKP